MTGRWTSGTAAAAGLAIVISACSGTDESATAVDERDAPATDTATAADEPSPATDVALTSTAHPATPEPDASTAPSVLTTDTEQVVPSRCRPSAAPDADPHTTIVLWHSLTGFVADVVTERVAQYEAEFPAVDVELVELTTGYQGIIQALQDADPVDLPDAVISSEHAVRLFADSERFVPVVECTDGTVPPDLADLLPVVARTYTVDSTLWAAPYNVSAPVMLYDRIRWEEAGLDPDDPPSTIEELEAAIRQLVDSGAATTGAVLYDRSAGWLLEEGAAQRGELLLQPDNGHNHATVTAVELETEWVVDTLTRMRDLKAAGYIAWEGLNESGFDDLFRLVHPTEPSGLTFNSSATLGNIIELQQSGDLPEVEIGVAPLPFGGVGSTAGGGAWWLYDSGDPERVGAAWRFVEWLTKPESVAELAAVTGYVPTTPTAAADPATVAAWDEYPVLKVAYDQLAVTNDSFAGAGIQVGPYFDVFRDLELAAAFTIDAGEDPATQLAERAALIADLLAAYGG